MKTAGWMRSMDTEAAPPEICGRFAPSASPRMQEIRARRLEWIRDRIFEGHAQAAIARALGISTVAVFKLVKTYGLDQDLPEPMGLIMLLRCRVGGMRRAFADAPRAAQYQLIRVAAANKTTIAEAAIRIVSEGTMQPALPKPTGDENG